MKNDIHGMLIGGSCIFKIDFVMEVATSVRNAVFSTSEEFILIWLYQLNSTMEENIE